MAYPLLGTRIVIDEEKVLNTENLSLLRCRTGNLFGVGMLEKGISQTLLPFNYLSGIDRHFAGIEFDLILYSTPPISIADVVQKLKRKTGAATYLLLKDIFPQNAVDIGILRPFMAKMLFRNKEKKLYSISDYIGCMSPANVEFLIEHNEINRDKVEVCPNSIRTDNLICVDANSGDKQIDTIIKPDGETLEANRHSHENQDDAEILRENTDVKRAALLSEYGIPFEKTIFLYGGNLGKPQDIPFIIECIKKADEVKEAHFVICGTGTEYSKLENFVNEDKPGNLTLINGLPKAEYDNLAGVCDVGMIFLDHRFTIPNFPSRLLSYLKEKMPVLICTDRNTDIGRITEENEFGLSSISDSTDDFVKNVTKFIDKFLRTKLGNNGYKYLLNNYTVEESYRIIMMHFENTNKM